MIWFWFITRTIISIKKLPGVDDLLLIRPPDARMTGIIHNGLSFTIDRRNE